MIKSLLIVFLGSGLGGALRFLVMKLTHNAESAFHWGTIMVNIIGCLLLGIFAGLFSRFGTSDSSLKLFLIMGICGGFTTFSTYINDGFSMMRQGEMLPAIMYLSLSVIGGYVALALAYYLTIKISL